MTKETNAHGYDRFQNIDDLFSVIAIQFYMINAFFDECRQLMGRNIPIGGIDVVVRYGLDIAVQIQRFAE